jgi:transposase
LRRPATLKPWLTEEGLLDWLRSAQKVDEYRRRLSIWLTHLGRWSAREISELSGVSVQAVWLWVGQYNRKGPGGLGRTGRGGRRWAFLSTADEQRFLAGWQEQAAQGRIITAKQMHADLCRRIGKPVSLAFVYRLLHRHQWRKLGPRPRHVKGSVMAQEEFKKNYRRRSR